MTIRPGFPIIFRLIDAARIETSGNCQKSPAAVSLKRPTRYRKSLIEKMISATNSGSDAIFSLNILFGREKLAVYRHPTPSFPGPIAMEAI
jgi:hypothetical protein